jgi:osmoprotectant transport system substrate-binding protein
MRWRRFTRPFVPLVALVLVLAACADDDTADPDPDAAPDDDPDDPDDVDVPDGPDITVASFDFPESTILAEIYGQAMEDAGYPVARELNIGARELIFPELEAGSIDLLPEYVGSALVVGFGEEPPADADTGHDELSAAFEDMDVTVLSLAPAENTNVFVTTADFAEEHGLSSVGDVADAGEVVFGGPPECEDRDTCYRGLQEVYGLDNVAFESIGEASARLVALTEGEHQLTLLFSTDAVLADESLVVLDEPEGMIPPENIVPVLRTDVIDAYGDDLVALLDAVSAELTTEVMISLNEQAGEGIDPAQIAADWLAEAGLV